jgi:DNA modification methylase
MQTSESSAYGNTNLKVQHVPIGKLRPWPGNPRIMPASEMESLCRSIRQWGMVEPLVVRRADHMVIGGHQRLEAAKALGMIKVPVVFVDVDEHQAKALNIALNKIHGHWDLPKLAELLTELQEVPDLDETLTGFDHVQMEQLLSELEHEQSPSPFEESFDVAAQMLRAQQSPAPTRVQRGDLWQLGKHRLLCADCTDPAAWERLMSGKRARAVVTDPPYGVGYVGGRAAQQQRIAKARRGVEQPSDAYWDELTPEAYRRLLTSALALAHRHTDTIASLYLWFASAHLRDVLTCLEEAGWQERNLIVWVKNNGAGALFAQYKHWFEPLFYAHKRGRSPRWHGPTNESTVWHHDKPAANELHPTMKPLALIERAIMNSTVKGQVVVDPFLGSGTAIIAAQRCGRICHGLDLEPRYCDVILARWEAQTGAGAVKLGNDGSQQCDPAPAPVRQPARMRV